VKTLIPVRAEGKGQRAKGRLEVRGEREGRGQREVGDGTRKRR
jgi:hypothetical protein